jgi:hypothetical protein
VTRSKRRDKIPSSFFVVLTTVVKIFLAEFGKLDYLMEI